MNVLNETWRIFDPRESELLPQESLDNVNVARLFAIYETMEKIRNYIICVVTSILERAERKNRISRQDFAGYLCSEWLTLT